MPPRAARSARAAASNRPATAAARRVGTAAVALVAILLAAWTPGRAASLRAAAAATLQAAREVVQFGGASTDPARGFFPAGCRWRDLPTKTAPEFWSVRQYEYWDDGAERWGREQPAACRLPVAPAAPGWVGYNNSQTSARCSGEHYCVFENLWYNQGRFYWLHNGSALVVPTSASRDVSLAPLSVRDPGAFAASVDAALVPGDTLLLDFLFFLHPTAIGHWHEHLAPLVSALRLEAGFTSPPARVLLLQLKRTHVFEWVRAVLAAAVGVLPGGRHLPPIYFQEEINSVWAQLETGLEGVPASTWLCLERVLVVKDTHTGGGRVALTQEDMRTYRRRAYRLHGVELPEAPPPTPAQLPTPPRVITFHRKSANRRVVNEAALIALLGEFAEVRVVEFSTSTPFADQLRAMAATGVLVSVHTSALANAVFLPPGRAVVELIHRNWVWWNLDRSFQAQTEAVGDVHHYAWRARGAEHVAYADPRDAQRFGGEEWADENCDTDECVEAHTKVDVVVDLEALRALLEDRLPHVWAGAPVAQARVEWPGWTGSTNSSEAPDAEASA